MTTAEEIARIVSSYVADHEDDFRGMKDDDIVEKVNRDVVNDAVWDGVLNAVEGFDPGPPDPYDEARERMLIEKYGDNAW